MNPLPPETTTPLGPQLRWCYDKNLGWPGRREDAPPMSVAGATVRRIRFIYLKGRP